MSWENVIGQNKSKAIIRFALLSGRIPHAWLFSGTEGIGKDAMAIETAKILLCNNQLDNIISCGECRSCKLVSKLQHPNLKFIFALPPGKNEDGRNDGPFLKLNDSEISLIQEQIVLKAKDNYHKISIPKAHQIKISSIREVKKDISFSSSEPGKRIIIISDADKMGDESANAFLKTLEEPSKDTLIILTTSNKDRLLPTIVSRCQEVRFNLLSDEEINNVLIEKYKTNSTEALLYSKLSGGSLTKALELKNGENISTLRNDVVSFLRASLRKSPLALYTEIDRVSNGSDKSRIEKFLILLLIWMRDIYSIKNLNNETKLVNQDQIPEINSFNSNFPKSNIKEIINNIDKSITAIKFNVQPTLVLTNLGLSIEQYCFNK
ncbi:MAG: DNA polymerase III subunit delta' [Chlorobi bacterium]|nr:DNA polymerase III subunit delta' [Chlorobiota bacterium]